MSREELPPSPLADMLGGLEGRVRVVEVGPRDGLQNQPRQLPAAVKSAWIADLAASGLEEIEATAFVHPRWVPQLADAGEVARALPRGGGTLFSALVPNVRGLEAAIAAGIDRIALFTAASEEFNRKNINATIEESLARFAEVFSALPRGADIHVRGYISCCFGCPYEGEVPAARVVEVARRLRDLGCHEIVISDTIGVATPADVARVVAATQAEIPTGTIALHLHDTRGTAIVNVFAALALGVRAFDAASGGLGGCPYAPGAAGNLSTEDLIYLLHGLGLETGVDLARLAEATLRFERHFDTPFPGRVLASLRPPR